MVVGQKLKSVAIASGAGDLGVFITRAFIERKDRVETIVVMNPPEISNDPARKKIIEEFKTQGARTETVDFKDIDAMSRIMKDIEVVIAPIGSMAMREEQSNLIEAAKKAGVRHFVPSEFGIDTSSPAVMKEMPTLVPKAEAVEKLEKAGMSYTRFMTGFFMDTFFLPWFGWDIPAGKAVIPGDGKSKVSFTHREDIGRYVAEYIISGKRDKVVKISPTRMTMTEAVAVIEKETGKKMAVTNEPAEAIKTRMASGKSDPMTFAIDELRYAIAKGYGNVEPSEESKIPTVKPIGMSDYIKRNFSK